MNTPFKDQLAQAFRDLIDQGSYGHNPEGGCDYMTRDGKSCIAGLWMKRQQPHVPLKRIGGPFVEVAQNYCPNMPELEVVALQIAQSTHDIAAVDSSQLNKQHLLQSLHAAHTECSMPEVVTSNFREEAYQLVKTALEQLP